MSGRATLGLSYRLLRRHPVEVALAVAAIAIGVGLSTAMWSILWGTILRGLPFKDAGRLTQVGVALNGETLPPSDVDFQAWRRSQRSFEGMAAWLGTSFNLSRPSEIPERLNGAYVTANTFRLVQVRPVLGRDFRAEDELPGAALVAIVSARVWEEQFHRDVGALGGSIKLNGRPAQVVGVMPAGFGFPLRQEIWVPLQLDAAPKPPGMRVQVFGKLKRGVSARQAEAELRADTVSLPSLPTQSGVRVTSFVDAYTEDLAPILYLLLAASLGLVLVVCATVSGLLTAQTVARLPEFAVRSAMGATPARLLLQLLAETLVLAGAGTIFSLPLATAAIRTYLALQGGDLRSFWMDVRLDPPALLYALVITSVVSLLSVLLPALQVSGPRLNEILKRGAGKGAIGAPGTASSARLVVQLAVAVALLVATGLVILSLGHLGQLNFGAAPETVLTAQLSLPGGTYPTPAKKIAFFHALEQRLDEGIGEGRTAFASALPGNVAEEAELEIEGQPPAARGERAVVQVLTVSAPYFPVLDVKALAGRLLGRGDSASGLPTAVVNRSFARRFFGVRSPLGHRLRLGRAPQDGPWRTIVGEVPDMVMGEVPPPHPEGVYLPLEQAPAAWMAVLVRTPGPPLRFTQTLKSSVAAVDAELPIFWAESLGERRAALYQPQKTMAQIFSVFGAAALFLALLGIYGVTSQSVASRSPEMAVRLTLGAGKGDLFRLLLRTALLQVLLGALVGLLLSLAASRVLSHQLFGVRGAEPGVLLAVLLFVVVVGVLACLPSSGRVLRVEPTAVLSRH